MAKKTKQLSECSSEYPQSMYLSDLDVEELQGLSVGDSVTVVLKGKVKSVEQRESYEDSKRVVGSLSLQDFECCIEGPSVWDDLCSEE